VSEDSDKDYPAFIMPPEGRSKSGFREANTLNEEQGTKNEERF
jgi:hypothetical protein